MPRSWHAAVLWNRRRAKVYYGATREQVQDDLVNAQKAVLDGLPLPDEKTTLAEFLDFWLTTSGELV